MSILEFLTAITPGKFIFGLRILDDNCKKLTIKFSIIRNSVVYFLIFMSLFPMLNYINKYEKWQEKKKFYVIRKKDISTVKNMTDV
ncbi:hypothetical protein Y10_07830 [Neptunitalea sp. Y10]|uniref:RDD domain-containing protein n=2 Tax=Neptunitalea lumnitzerae TaxID=2965509 RepID=A0ABQ5MG96_9FLAO|nr:hypothetical protein Y10_07830 [Neptunitalea sp. Y10]